MRPDDLIRVRHMLEAAHTALIFVAGKERSDLDDDYMLWLALMKTMEIIGEAAMNISVEFRESCTDIPWAKIAGMRHRLVHAYSDVNLNILWHTITNDLPPLIHALEKVVKSK